MSKKIKIMEIIEKDPIAKEIYENNSDCFENVVLHEIEKYDNEDKAFEHIIFMLLSLSALYDKLLNNIAQYGNKELIEKCASDINSIYTIKE